MIEDKLIAVVVPAYNEGTQILSVIDSMPKFVDRIVIVNDGSTDNTSDIIRSSIEAGCKSDVSIEKYEPLYSDSTFDRAEVYLAELREKEEEFYPKHTVFNSNNYDRVVLIDQENSGVGGAVSVGYKWCREHRIDCTGVMDGDGQMDPSELKSIVEPVCREDIDYVKGDRLSHKAARYIIPKIRRFGNRVLSLLTKIASGYWHISDSQSGYTAISLNALDEIDLYKIYRRYGYPNDILTKLNAVNCSIRLVPIKPVYDVGEQSSMKIGKVIPRITWLLIKCFFYRISEKYFKNSFHPLFLFYIIGIALFIAIIPIFIYIIHTLYFTDGRVTTGIYMLFVLFAMFSFQAMGFGMWMDIQDNEKLNK